MEATTSFKAGQDAASAYEIADSTDWLNTPAAGLMPVEQALRCHVCKDFYNSPMLTSYGKCPLCRATDQESKLRGNWALREVVEAFVKARPALIEVARRPPESPEGLSRRSHSPKRKAADLDSPDSSQTKRTRSSARLSKKARATAEGTPPQYADNNDEDDDYRPDVSDNSETYKDDGLVACPICHARMKDWAVDKHLDTSCPGAPPTAAASKSGRNTTDFTTPPNHSATRRQAPTQPPPERLPSLNYSLLKDLQLRKKLTELGISTAGSRALLEMRHREWVTIWNANCDSSRPKRRSELLRDLDVWERTLGGGRASGPQSLGGGGGGASATPLVKDKDFDGAAWGARHDDSFKQLIANARRTRAQTGKDDGGEQATGGNGRGVVDGTIVGPVDKPSSQTLRPDGVVDLTIQSSPSLADLPRKPPSDFAVQQSGDVHSPGKIPVDHGVNARFFAEESAPSAPRLEPERPFQEIG